MFGCLDKAGETLKFNTTARSDRSENYTVRRKQYLFGQKRFALTDCAIGSAHHKGQLVGNIAVAVLVGLGGDAIFI